MRRQLRNAISGPWPSGASNLSQGPGLGMAVWGLILLIAGFGTEILAQVDIAAMESSTVRVFCGNAQSLGSGSGFVIGNGRHIATNWHVVSEVENGSEVAIVLDAQHVYTARVFQAFPAKDLAILEVSEDIGLKPVVFALRPSVYKTQTVYALGYPGAADRSEDSVFEIKVTRGIISGFVTLGNNTPAYQIDAALNPGNSGGPLFNECGHLIGINTEKSLRQVVAVEADGNQVLDRVPGGEGVAWSVQSDELVAELEQLGIPYQVARGSCNESNLVLWSLVGLSILLGFAALVLVMTQRGRQVVHQAVTRVLPRVATSQQAPEKRENPNSAMDRQALLVGIAGEFKDNQLKLDHQPLIIGRDPNIAQLVFSATKEISKRHCRLVLDPKTGQMTLEDCWSRNGTFLCPDIRLEPGVPQPLTNGSRFRLGGPETEFEVKIH